MIDLEKELLEFCSDILYKLADFGELADLYWIRFGGEGEHYCYDCCKKEVEKINKEYISKGEEPEAMIDGGWGSIEEDGCTFCNGCEVRLETSLTRYGVESEVDHFLSCDLIDQKELDNGQMIELYNVFYYGTAWDFDEQYEKDLLRLAKIVSSCLGEHMGFNNRFEIIDL